MLGFCPPSHVVVLLVACVVGAVLRWASESADSVHSTEWQAIAPLALGNSEATLLSEEKAYERYFTVYDRRYSLKSPYGSKELRFDVVGHPSLEGFLFVVVCPVLAVADETPWWNLVPLLFHRRLRTFAFVIEFAAGSGSRHYALPTGGVERGETPEDAARRELREEAGLEVDAAKLVPLLPASHPGILEVKWARNRFLPFLALDARPISPRGGGAFAAASSSLSPQSAEDEEFGISGFTTDEAGAWKLLKSGSLFLPSSVTFQLATDWLREHSSA